MLWAYVVDGVVVPLAGLGDFSGLFRSRHVARPPAVADLPGCKDEASRWLKGKKRKGRRDPALRVSKWEALGNLTRS